MEEARDGRDRAHRRFFAVPATRLGRRAAGATGLAIVFVFVANALIELGPHPPTRLWQGLLFWTMIAGFYGACVLGIAAIVRKRERSWMVVLPTTIIALVAANELVQGALHLFGVDR